MEKETKTERFKRVAERRVRAILRDMRILGNCGNRGNYSYSEEPKNGSKAWGIKAEGYGKSDLDGSDKVILTSDENGQISCQGYGKLTGGC